MTCKEILSKMSRQSYCLDDLVSTHHPAKKSVMLGFARDGRFLIAYSGVPTQAYGDWCLIRTDVAHAPCLVCCVCVAWRRGTLEVLFDALPLTMAPSTYVLLQLRK